MGITRHTELRVYERSVELRIRVFELSKTWPTDERYALTGQARRSSRSVGANIAEGWAKRRYRRHFVSKLTDALAEAEETNVWLDVARECEYLSEEDHVHLRGVCRASSGASS
jgi:four helix bundle protein